MVEFGLTGGIGCGKSTVSGMLRELGAYVIDADVLARDALAPGSPAAREVARIFGEGVILPDGGVDRKAVAEVVFRDAGKRARLEAAVHPHVFREEARLVAEIYRKDPHAVIIFDAALLIESGAYRRMDGVLLVSCSKAAQMARLTGPLGLTAEEAELRVAAQMPLVEKARFATFIIDNDGSLDDTRRQVAEVHAKLKAAA